LRNLAAAATSVADENALANRVAGAKAILAGSRGRLRSRDNTDASSGWGDGERSGQKCGQVAVVASGDLDKSIKNLEVKGQ
jgi:hypothetical protein